jgi:hypothetical protein
MPAVSLARLRRPVVWDTNECQSLHYRRLPGTLSNRAKQYVWIGLERWTARRCAVAIAIGEVEAAAWAATHPVLQSKLAVVDHAAFTEPRDPGAARGWLCATYGIDTGGPILLFLGTMRAKQNVAAVQWIRETLMPTLPAGVTVALCGPGTEAMRAGGAGTATLVGLGAVDDVDSVVAAADLCLAPLAAGAGVKTKVLHYLAHAKRVAGTPIAFEGLADAPGLFSADLQDLPALIQSLSATDEDASSKAVRTQSQLAWLELHHGRVHIAEQWRKVVACLPT